jgi:sugar-specific transcriptional regulator TrmB
LDHLLFNQLKESNFKSPEISDVVYDQNQVLEILSVGTDRCEKSASAYWDAEICKWASRYYVETLELIKQKMVKERGISCKLLVDANHDNIDFLKSLDFLEIKHLEGLKGNFGLYDDRLYMVVIMQDRDEKLLQTFFSNSRSLVEKQLSIYNDLWKMAKPLSSRIKELEYQNNAGYDKSLLGIKNIQDEINFLLDQTSHELTIFSNSDILKRIFDSNMLKDVSSKLMDNIATKILLDNYDDSIHYQIKLLNGNSESSLIQLGYSNRLGDFDEMIICFDGKYVLHIQEDGSNNLKGSFTNDSNKVLVHEIVFEKYWNEVKSLEIANN